MIFFDCAVCRTKLSAGEAQVDAWVLCPNCRTKLQVPRLAAQAATQPVPQMAGTANRPPADIGFAPPPASPSRAPVPSRFGGISPGALRPGGSGGKRYGFNCGYCSSRLEATEAMAAHDGQCPTCGNSITIPIQDRYGRLIDPKTRQIIKQDPHPVHAYAAAGDRAPAILRQGNGKQIIRCPRCSAASPITANNCKACGMPFTMEGTTLEAAGSSSGFAVAGLVLGIIGIPAGCAIIFSVLALVFGGMAYHQVSRGGGEGGKGMPIAALILGGLGLMIGIYFDFLK